MTGALSWESILQYVSGYNPLDSGADLACDGFASTAFAISALLSGYATAKYGYLGYLVLFIQKQGMLGLRTSVIFANFQKGLGAVFRVFLVYMAKFRMGLVRMTLYTYATFISGSQLLWVSPSKRSSRRLFLFAQLSTLTAGYAGEGSTSYVFKTLIEKAKKKPSRGTGTPDPPPPAIQICARGATGTNTRPGCTCYLPEDPGCTCYLPEDPGCACYVPVDRLVGGMASAAATARESFFLGEQYNWRPHVCPILGEGAREGLRTCCYSESSCTEKSPETEEHKPVENGPPSTEVESLPGQPQQKNGREMRNRIRKKLFAAKLPGTILGTVLAAVFSSENFFKISTAVSIISYNLFFWMGAQCYELGELENDIAGEKKSGEMEKHDKKDEEKVDVKDEKQISDGLVPELKKAIEVVLKLFPLWLTFASTCYLVNATGDTFFMGQVDYLENHTQSFKIPQSVFYSFPDIVSITTGQVCYYIIKQYHDEKKEARWARLLRISTGMLFSSLCCIVASLVARRLDSNYNSASMLWLLPQFFLWGMMKGILEEGLEEFLHDHLNNDVQVQAVIGTAEAVGSFLSMILTAASPGSWVGSGNDISQSHLDYYYRMLTIITLFSTFLFTIVAIADQLRNKKDT